MIKLFGKISRVVVNKLKFRFYTMVFTQWFHKIIMHCPLKLKCELESLSRTRAITANVLQLQEVGDFGDENCLPPLNLIRSTKLHLTTEPPISCRCCYMMPLHLSCSRIVQTLYLSVLNPRAAYKLF